MSPRVVIIGAGGHAKVLADALIEIGREVLGLTDVNAERWGQSVAGAMVLGDDQKLAADYSAGEVELVNGVGAVDSAAVRREVFRRLRSKGYRFASVVHPRATVSRHASLGEGVQVMAGAVIQPGVSVGENSIVNTSAVIDHDCEIGEHVHIAPGAVLCGAVIVGAGAHVGAGAVIRQGMRIGAEAMVGAGAVVVRAVADGETVVGVPAKPMRPL